MKQIVNVLALPLVVLISIPLFAVAGFFLFGLVMPFVFASEIWWKRKSKWFWQV